MRFEYNFQIPKTLIVQGGENINLRWEKKLVNKLPNNLINRNLIKKSLVISILLVKHITVSMSSYKTVINFKS